MNWVTTSVIAVIFAGVTASTYFASTTGLGLSGMLDKPVSVRQDSPAGAKSRGPRFLYFFGTRRHSGGGFRGGK